MAKISAHGSVIGTVEYLTKAKRYMSDGVILKNSGFGWEIAVLTVCVGIVHPAEAGRFRSEDIAKFIAISEESGNIQRGFSGIDRSNLFGRQNLLAAIWGEQLSSVELGYGNYQGCPFALDKCIHLDRGRDSQNSSENLDRQKAFNNVAQNAQNSSADTDAHKRFVFFTAIATAIASALLSGQTRGTPWMALAAMGYILAMAMILSLIA
jgi:hypothetical protein